MKSSRLKQIFGAKSTTLVLVVFVIIVFFYSMNNNYLGRDNIRGILNSISLSGTIAVGMACLLIGGQVDLAAGAVGCMAGILVAFFINFGIPWPIAVLLSVLFGVVAGLITSFLVNVLRFMAFISTIALASIYQGFIKVLTNNQSISMNDSPFKGLGSTVILGIPLPFIIMVVLLVVYGIMLSYTRFGRSIYMCGGNLSAARLAGLNPKKISTMLFVNCGAISSLGGVILASRMHAGTPSNVIGSEFDAITGAVLGGIAFTGGSGSMFGCFLGLLVINTFNNGLTIIGVREYWQTVARGGLLIIALTIDVYRERARLRSLKEPRQNAASAG